MEIDNILLGVLNPLITFIVYTLITFIQVILRLTSGYMASQKTHSGVFFLLNACIYYVSIVLHTSYTVISYVYETVLIGINISHIVAATK